MEHADDTDQTDEIIDTDHPDAPVPPTPKIAVVVRDDLASWQALNVTAFLVSGIGTRLPDVVGEPYVDGSGLQYLPMFGHPVLVFAADAVALARAGRPRPGAGPRDGRLHRRPVRHRQRRGQPGRGGEGGDGGPDARRDRDGRASP